MPPLKLRTQSGVQENRNGWHEPGMALVINAVREGDRSRKRRAPIRHLLGVFLEGELSSWAEASLNPAISAKHAPYYVKRAKNRKNGERQGQNILLQTLPRTGQGFPHGEKRVRVSSDAMHDRARRCGLPAKAAMLPNFSCATGVR
jgi:hypothetical protein